VIPASSNFFAAECNLRPEPISIARDNDRHSHIGIRLHCRVDDKWERVEALAWNAAGFNFLHPRALDGPLLELKRGLTLFDGMIVWRSPNPSDDVLVEAIANELIFKRAKTGAAELRGRLLKLIRVAGMGEQKLKVLASLGVVVTGDTMATLLTKRRREQPMFHYGVQVQSQGWSEIVSTALSISSVIISMERWSDALVKS
jgi:hypothetical protein